MTLVRLEEVTKTFAYPSIPPLDPRHLRRVWRRGPQAEEVVSPLGYPQPVVALDRVNLVVRSGETLCVIGPSGCGKTTLLRVIAGLLTPDSGHVYYDGEDVTRTPPYEKRIGMVFQSYALYPHMTAFENLAFYFRIHKRQAEIPERVRAVSQVMGIGFDALLCRMPRHLSEGQKQRVAIGRCIAREPRLFLFDEPLSNLDAQLRVRTRIEIKKLLQRFRITTLYVTHDQTEAMALADRIAVMSQGRVEQVGTYQELYRLPANRSVAGFVGTPAMNFLEGQVTERGTLRFGSLEIPLSRFPRLRRRRLEAGRAVILGVRPEHLTLDPEGPLPCTVEVVQPLPSEHEQVLHLRGPLASPWVARLPSHPPIHKGERIRLSFDPDFAHLFDAADGERIR
ncbi:MAG: ABC transporter ATP-binding protein [Anaerolineae bacterium]